MRLFLLTVTLVGVIMILAADVSGNREATSSVIIRDLGIALIVSAFITFAVELNASTRLRMDVAVDVMEAVYRHIIPPVIWSQVSSNVLRQDVICRDWELDIEVRSPEIDPIARRFEEAIGPGIHLVHYISDRTIENIKARPINYTVIGTVDADLCVATESVPRFHRIKVTGLGGSRDLDVIFQDKPPVGDDTEPGAIYAKENIQSALLTDDRANPEDKKFGNIVLKYERNRELRFELPCRIPASGKIRVRYDAWRGIRSPGLFVYTLGVPADGIKVKLSGTDNLDAYVEALHPDADEIENPSRREWRLNRGFLPGQGVQINFRPVRTGPRVGEISTANAPTDGADVHDATHERIVRPPHQERQKEEYLAELEGTLSADAIGKVDRSYWESRTADSLWILDQLYLLIKQVHQDASVRYTDNFVGIVRNGTFDDQITFYPKEASQLNVLLKMPRSEGLDERLEQSGLDSYGYKEDVGSYEIRLMEPKIRERPIILFELIALAYGGVETYLRPGEEQ